MRAYQSTYQTRRSLNKKFDMILFFESGRLGNQLFQYFGIKAFFPDHKVILIGDFSDLIRVINSSRIIYICFNIKVYRKIMSYLYSLVNFLGKVRVISTALAKETSEDYSFEITKGIIHNIIFIPKAYFQHYTVIKKFDFDFQNIINSELINTAKVWYRNNSIDLDSSIAFVHIRRNDYCSWPSSQNPAILGIKWYLKAIDLLRKQANCSTIILLGDDPFYLVDIMDIIRILQVSIVTVHISNSDRVSDLGIMSLCSHGILSASTFAWWGAFFSRTCFTQSSNPVYIAPTYWAGHRMMDWYPKGFQFDWITYLDVEY